MPTRSTIDRATATAARSSRPGQHHRELVAAEPEALASLPQARRDLSEDAVADGVAVAVVDALEVVDVDEAQAQRQLRLLGLGELDLEPLVEVAVIAEPVSGSVSASRIARMALKVERW